MKPCVGADCGGNDDGSPVAALAKAKRVCMAPAVTGRCRARIDRIAFDVEKRACVPFVYGGCGGNDNNFLSREKCLETCGPLRDMLLGAGAEDDDDDDDDDDEDDVEKELNRINSI